MYGERMEMQREMDNAGNNLRQDIYRDFHDFNRRRIITYGKNWSMLKKALCLLLTDICLRTAS